MSHLDPKPEDDNRFNAAPTHLKGTYDAKKKALTFFSKVSGGPGQEFEQRQVNTAVDARTRRFESFITMDVAGQKQEFKIMEIISKKRE